MTMRLSTGLRNFLNKQGGIDDALRNGIIEIYSGAQPASADAAPTGTLLATITTNSAGVTPETLATGTLTLTGGAAGSVNTVTVNSVDILGAVVPFNATLNQTASDVAAQINRTKTSPDYTASAAGSVVTITALPGSGTTPNGLVVAATTTTITSSAANMAGGVAPANGLRFEASVGGTMFKRAADAWSGANAASGNAGWFRQYGSVSDSHALDSVGTALRMDGAIATAGAELNLNNTALVSGATTTIAGWSMTVPAQ